ncbi:unnamed protein product [Rodentolepis nana]|uniref:Endo/exonuclease/phosphatase domain-containing protein n=1 Tax=Rodentolepis nana TaxID=102285 RepID=A0A0R3TRW6_RODNA|nr:unnamed protein product [Rodentolepis nana]
MHALLERRPADSYAGQIKTSADPPVECWRDVTVQKILQTYDVDIFTIMEANISDDKLNTTMEANISDDKLKCHQFPGYTLYLLKYYQFPGYTLYNLPKYRQVASGILTGVKEGLTSHYDLIMRSCYITLELIDSNEDPATYLDYNGTRIAPDLLLASRDISEHTRRKIIDDPGSGHKPVIASINIGSKSMTTKVLTKLPWNLKKADWPRFTNLLENEFHTSPLNFNQHPEKHLQLFPKAGLNTIE